MRGGAGRCVSVQEGEGGGAGGRAGLCVGAEQEMGAAGGGGAVGGGRWTGGGTGRAWRVEVNLRTGRTGRPGN